MKYLQKKFLVPVSNPDYDTINWDADDADLAVEVEDFATKVCPAHGPMNVPASQWTCAVCERELRPWSGKVSD